MSRSHAVVIRARVTSTAESKSPYCRVCRRLCLSETTMTFWQPE